MHKVNSLSPFKLGPQTSHHVPLPAKPSHQNLKVGIITLANYFKNYIHVNQEESPASAILSFQCTVIIYFKIYFLHVIACTFMFAKCCI